MSKAIQSVKENYPKAGFLGTIQKILDLERGKLERSETDSFIVSGFHVMIKSQFKNLTFISILILVTTLLWAQERRGRPGGPPPTRKHTVNESEGIKTVRSNQKLSQNSKVKITEDGTYRVIQSNGIPNHLVGAFPNRGNPHKIASQKLSYKIPLKPRELPSPKPIGMQVFGVAINGIPFDPSAAEWYQGVHNSPWQYEALSGAVPLGVDESHAHVQPTGMYHYHGLPKLLLKDLNVKKGEHSRLVGWAADGHPIYAKYGYANPKDAKSKIVELKSSYRLKKGRRPSGSGQPGGNYDGTFTADYEYVSGFGDLDECNGRYCVTPEMPEGGYAYFLTESWPVISRFYKSSPSKDFERGGPGPGFGFPGPPPRR